MEHSFRFEVSWRHNPFYEWEGEVDVYLGDHFVCSYRINDDQHPADPFVEKLRRLFDD